MTAYADFLASKARRFDGCGFDVDPDDLHPSLFGFQREVTAWALRKGRAALLLDTGLGKTRCQVEWARKVVEHTDGQVLILAPLAVAQQTVREAAAIGTVVVYARDAAEAARLGPSTVEARCKCGRCGKREPAKVEVAWDNGVDHRMVLVKCVCGHKWQEPQDYSRLVITNYERLHLFDTDRFAGVVLDESSILKAFSGKVKRRLVAAFADTPYRLACTATPAPNDVEELCNHADFLGVMSPAEMRSTFFIAATRAQFMKYRLKGHAEQAFYRWMASWAMALRKPSDLGFDDAGFDLPPLHVHEHVVAADWQPTDRLFADRLNGVTERAEVRAATINARVEKAVEVING